MKNNSQIIHQNKSCSLFFWGICFILFLSIILLPPIFQPSDWARTILFRAILTVLLSFFIFKYFYKKELSFSIPKWKISTYLPFLLLSCFFVTIILATIFSQDIRFSVFGSPPRAGGSLNLLFFFIFSIILTIFIKENDWKRLFNLLFIIGFLASLLAVIQYFNLFKNIFISFEGGSTPSFFGNSTFLAIYMIFLVFLSFTLFTQEKTKKKKIIYAALFFLFIFAILITSSRAAYLGLLIGFFYFFLFYPKKLKTLKAVAASLLLFAILIVILFNFFPQLAEKNNLLKIAVNRLSIKRVAIDLAGTRFSAWKITLEAIKDKPILGWGPENFYIGFEKYYNPALSNLQKLWWDRPHNIFLDIAVTSGIVSALLYFIFWIALLWQLQKFKREQGDNKDTYLAHGIQAMFIGYLVALFFNFESFSTYLISFFFIGYSFYLISEKKEKITIRPLQNKILAKNPVFVSFLLLIFLFLWFYNIKPLYVAGQIDYAKNLIDKNKCDKGLLIMNDAWKKSNILKSFASLRYSDFLKKCAGLKPEKEVEYVTMGLESLKISSVFQPKYTRTWLFMGAFADVLAAREQNPDNKNKLLSEARNYLKKAEDLSPGRQEIIIEMAKNYLVAEDYNSMKKFAEDCVKIDQSQGECYWYLGIAEIFLGDQVNGKKHIKESKEKNYNDPAYIQLGVAYISQKNYKDAAEAYHMLTSSFPENASYHAVMAFLSREIGNYKRAGAEAVLVFKLQPGNKEAQKFLEQLLGLSPNDPSIHSSLAFVYRQLGEEEKAQKELLISKSIYLQLISKEPKKAEYRFYLAGVYKELGEYEKAYQETLLTIELDPGFITQAEQFLQLFPTQFNFLNRYAEYIKNKNK